MGWITNQRRELSAPLPHANFELTATLTKDGVTAISYPTVTVINGEATWDSMSGEYGSGSSVVGILVQR